MKRHITVLALSAALSLAPLAAMAADGGPSADLAPGPAAGVQNAQGMFANSTYTYVAIGVAVAALVAVAASGDNGGGSVSTTTTGVIVP
jgi:hypothetical protein